MCTGTVWYYRILTLVQCTSNRSIIPGRHFASPLACFLFNFGDWTCQRFVLHHQRPCTYTQDLLHSNHLPNSTAQRFVRVSHFIFPCIISHSLSFAQFTQFIFDYSNDSIYCHTNSCQYAQPTPHNLTRDWDGHRRTCPREPPFRIYNHRGNFCVSVRRESCFANFEFPKHQSIPNLEN